ncbi:MAG TPA: hypothetical protein VGM90_28395 [Kofleriaceae bacterium]
MRLLVLVALVTACTEASANTKTTGFREMLPALAGDPAVLTFVDAKNLWQCEKGTCSAYPLPTATSAPLTRQTPVRTFALGCQRPTEVASWTGTTVAVDCDIEDRPTEIHIADVASGKVRIVPLPPNPGSFAKLVDDDGTVTVAGEHVFRIAPGGTAQTFKLALPAGAKVFYPANGPWLAFSSGVNNKGNIGYRATTPPSVIPLVGDAYLFGRDLYLVTHDGKKPTRMIEKGPASGPTSVVAKGTFGSDDFDAILAGKAESTVAIERWGTTGLAILFDKHIELVTMDLAVVERIPLAKTKAALGDHLLTSLDGHVLLFAGGDGRVLAATR